MAKIKITWTVEEDDAPVRGNLCATGDYAEDKAHEDEVIGRLINGDVWAWACVVCHAKITVDGETFHGSACLGGCNYASRAEFMRHESDNLQEQAIEDLRASLDYAVKRCRVAQNLTEIFGELELDDEV